MASVRRQHCEDCCTTFDTCGIGDMFLWEIILCSLRWETLPIVGGTVSYTWDPREHKKDEN